MGVLLFLPVGELSAPGGAKLGTIWIVLQDQLLYQVRSSADLPAILWYLPCLRNYDILLIRLNIMRELRRQIVYLRYDALLDRQ